ncbi:flagellar hook-basal body complex protein FliE [uncultured Trichococcus sp.]|uniref:flagellar hook-basal body complex protein FliE n=1 Tax=uncultured Trichococcus sp. TaxID=189665 RepID=UPI0029C7D343|nr:flagellar hook-basal body complex protein FliE [uncultured Trichococcus sp.]
MAISLPIYNLGSSPISSNLTSEISSLSGNTGIQNDNDTASFDNLLGKSMTMLNETQNASDAATQSLIMGDSENLHDVMIKATEAQLALDLAVQVRNKSLEAFNEIKNMQF